MKSEIVSIDCDSVIKDSLKKLVDAIPTLVVGDTVIIGTSAFDNEGKFVGTIQINIKVG